MKETKPVAAADPVRYRSYLVRLWREQDEGPWRCQVRCVVTGQELRFGGLEGLFEFLKADAAGEPEPNVGEGSYPLPP